MAHLKQDLFQIENKLLVVFGIFASLVLLHSIGVLSWTIPCGIKHFFHVECFACGTTEAIIQLFEGNIVESWKCNPLGIIISSYFSIRVLYLIVNKIAKK